MGAYLSAKDFTSRELLWVLAALFWGHHDITGLFFPTSPPHPKINRLNCISLGGRESTTRAGYGSNSKQGKRVGKEQHRYEDEVEIELFSLNPSKRGKIGFGFFFSPVSSFHNIFTQT